MSPSQDPVSTTLVDGRVWGWANQMTRAEAVESWGGVGDRQAEAGFPWKQKSGALLLPSFCLLGRTHLPPWPLGQAPLARTMLWLGLPTSLTRSVWPEHRLDGLHWSSQGCLGGKAQAADS